MTSQTPIPSFAVVGKVNMGKSSVLSTLLEVDEDKKIRVSSTPGETTRTSILPLILDGEERIRFIDTPGFGRPIEAMRAIQDIHGEGTPNLESIKKFIAQYSNSEEFIDERLLLEPIVEGAGILYLCDTTKPLRDSFIAEMEILRWTGHHRMALLNNKGEDATHEQEWRNRLGSYFNLVRTFNAHKARFEERMRLLKSLFEIDERYRQTIEETLDLLENEWAIRREESAEAIIDFLEKSLSLRESVVLEERDIEVTHRRERHESDLQKLYFEKMSDLDQACSKKLLKIYQHHLLTPEIDTSIYQNIDLESEETWSKWGLSKGQLTAVAGIAGAAAGVAVDIGTGGLSHGFGTLFGALSGAAAAFLKGDDLPDLKIDLRGGAKLSSGEGRSLSVGPPKSANFPWVLLDGILIRYQQILHRAHGRRDEESLNANNTEIEGFTKDFPRDIRTDFAKWFESCLEGSPDRGREPKIYRELVNILEEIS